MSEGNIIDPDGDCIFCLQRVVNAYTESERIEGENEAAQDLDDDDESIPENSKTTTELQEVKYLVSSKHMMLVSPVFKAMFRHKNGFKEGGELHAAGIVNVPLPDDNPDAFLMLLNIIHCLDAEIPLVINLQSLCDFAVLVDKYRMHGAVRIVSSIWIDALMEESNTYKVDDYGVLLWLCIAWVFSLKKSFRYFTRLLMVLGDKPLSTRLSDHGVDLPIPDRVVEAIDAGREELIVSCLGSINNMIEDFQARQLCMSRFEGYHHPYHVSHEITSRYREECDSMMLGSLIRGLETTGLNRGALPPFNGISPPLLWEKIKRIKLISPCQWNLQPSRENHVFADGECHSKKRNPLVDDIYKIQLSCDGLSIKDYQGR